MFEQFVVTLAALSIFAFAAWFLLRPRLSTQGSHPTTGVPLDQVIRAIKAELRQIAGTPGDTAGLSLGDVIIEITSQRDTKDGQTLGLTVPVFSETALKAEHSRKLTRAAKTTIVLQSPAGGSMLERQSGMLDLSDLVLAARSALLATMSEEPRLNPKSVDIEVNFVLTATNSGSAGFKAYVVNLGAASDLIETGGNKIVLKYANPTLKAAPK